ncbi:kinesin-like protein KIF16B isoform X4 [Danio rerio]|uniref:Kinesin-like protein KIF16B isoform X4 n=1 Tax=Danio rerio TaxID=7955 RepID=A0AC58H2Q0_DANRE
MASVRVAVRVRPLSQREKDLSAKVIIQVDGQITSVLSTKENFSCMNGELSGERVKSFSYDFSYDSMNSTSLNFVTQEKIFKDLGTDVLQAAFEGYNACVFAYGQTGSGKTYTMMGNPGDYGLIPRICEGLFHHIGGVLQKDKASFHMEVSYFEIYNERVRDLLPSTETQGCELRVREHPKDGPYVDALSRHQVQSYTEVGQLMQEGNKRRATANTGMNNVSSRSHAIFTIRFIKAMFDGELPSETVSKVHLVDLAGSERADATQTTGIRLKEGANINRSLVTLGIVISTLAISPADVNYSETLNTLRYASRAKNILNKPTVNEDSNVKIIRELQAEIARLKALLSAGNQMPSFEQPSGSSVEERLHQDEARVQELTKQWASRWKEIQTILGEDAVALRKEGIGVVLDSQIPYLIRIDEDLLSTGVVLYHLKEGITSVGAGGTKPEQDIVLHGEALQREHCVFENQRGAVTLVPLPGARCAVSGMEVTQPYLLSQGVNIQLGKATMFHFNHPQEAAQLREKRKSGLFVPSNSAAFSVETFSDFRLWMPFLQKHKNRNPVGFDALIKHS